MSMETTTREVISLSMGAGVFVALTLMRMPPVIGGTAALISYAAVRTLLPAGGSKRDRERERELEFLESVRGEARELRELSRSKGIPRGVFRDAVRDLVEVVEKLMHCFEQSPRRMAVATHFPGKLSSLREVLEGYVSLSEYRDDTEVAEEALRRAERVIPVAVGQFRELLGRLLQDDVVRLSANARVYEELMDFEV